MKAYDSSDNYSEASSPLVVETETIKSVTLAAHYNHSLQVKDDGTVWAWGNNNYGQLGDGTTTKRLAAVQVINLKAIVAVAAGEQFSLALKNDGTVWAWGSNYYGELGNGTTNESGEPTQVIGLNNIIDISAGYGFNLALKDDGTVHAWGYNYYGQLGEGTNNSLIPIKVNGLSDVKNIFCDILV